MNDQFAQMPQEQKRRVTDSWGNFFSSLMSADDRRNDSITFGGGIAVVVDCIVFLVDGIGSSEPAYVGFGGSIAAIIGAMGAAKLIRDRTTDIVTTIKGNGNGGML